MRPTRLLFIVCACTLTPWPAEGSETPTAEPGAAGGSVVFASRAAEPGQRVEQTVVIQLDLKSRSRQGADILEEAQTRMTRTRQRVVTTTRVESGLAVGAQVAYLQSRLERDGASPTVDPIDGHTYNCLRKGEQLKVSTEQGAMPTKAEFDLVAENMETLGRENALATFLAGKRVSVGQRLTVPPDVARRLLGMKSQLGEVRRFELTLQKLELVDARPCAVFQADLEAQRTDGSQMRLLIGGPMTIEVDTCRAIASTLSGPIGMSHSTPDPRGRLQVDSTGRLSLSVAACFKDPVR
ncbi:MAG: hypothetical protein KDA37_01160 [Planctomycetales bacterium]|nr:hypothetical protein [Planctomycetales bacterium]